MGGPGFRCLHCGAEQDIGMPCPIKVMEAWGKNFESLHKSCEPSEAGAARFKYSNPSEWARSWDVGISSATIFATFAGIREVANMPIPGYPLDADDFGRCYRLLKVAPASWRDELYKLVNWEKTEKEWQALVDHWSELTKLYEEELPADKFPKFTARIRELLGRSV